MSRLLAARIARPFEHLIFAGRWVIAPMYVGLLFVLGVYVWHSCLAVFDLFYRVNGIDESDLMLVTLGAVDAMMVANLVAFVMIGSYSIFVRTLTFDDSPTWLVNITSGILKIKMSTSLIGITSIHLLRDFVGAEKVEWDLITKHGSIHLVFLVSALALTVINRHTPHAAVTPPAPHR